MKKASGTPVRHIAFLVYPGFQIQDLSGPLAAFEVAGTVVSPGSYRLHTVSRDGGPVRSSSGLEVMTSGMRHRFYDTLVVVGGGEEIMGPESTAAPLFQTIRKAERDTRRIASVCTGAFILAGAGLLENRLATTHWRYAAHLRKLYPNLKVEGDRIFTKDGNIWTSAGITAGIDLALAMIEEDLGGDVSRSTARMLVVYHRRPGGQSQFSAMLEMEPESDRIRKVLSHIRENIGGRLAGEDLAGVAGVSPRQFSRIFLSETGETPAKAIERLRAEVARPRIEHSTEPIEAIAVEVGFGDPERMRRAFIRTFGHPPQSFRRMAAGNAARR
jgi:transcriptional regulator GlxA family with amidase domain